MSKVVKKVWGKEIIYKNDENYCVKLLFVDQGKCCSIHLHKAKTESFLSKSGKVLLEVWEQLPENYTEENLKSVVTKMPSKRIILEPYSEFAIDDNSVVTIKPRTPHRFYGLNDCNNAFFETSTTDSSDDSYRAIKSMGLYDK